MRGSSNVWTSKIADSTQRCSGGHLHSQRVYTRAADELQDNCKTNSFIWGQRSSTQPLASVLNISIYNVIREFIIYTHDLLVKTIAQRDWSGPRILTGLKKNVLVWFHYCYSINDNANSSQASVNLPSCCFKLLVKVSWLKAKSFQSTLRHLKDQPWFLRELHLKGQCHFFLRFKPR